jgi:hypothetical protein
MIRLFYFSKIFLLNGAIILSCVKLSITYDHLAYLKVSLKYLFFGDYYPHKNIELVFYEGSETMKVSKIEKGKT